MSICDKLELYCIYFPIDATWQYTNKNFDLIDKLIFKNTTACLFSFHSCKELCIAFLKMRNIIKIALNSSFVVGIHVCLYLVSQRSFILMGTSFN